jgi:type II secretory pathway component PulF
LTYRLLYGRAAWLRFVSTVPVLGPLSLWSGVAQWCGLLSVLIKYQIPLPEALRLAAAGSRNAYVGSLSAALADGAAKGRGVSQMLAANRRWPASLRPLVRWGEQSDTLAEALSTAGEMLRQRVRKRALMLQTVLPPILFIAIGCGVVGTVCSLFMPLIAMIEGLS